MNADRSRRTARRLLPWFATFYVIMLLFPVQYRVTRALIVLGAFLLWGGALFVRWQRRRVRFTMLGLLGIVVLLVSLPGRQPDPEGLRADYRRALALYGHARYFWGGETPLGIDCSGLVREGLVTGQLINGVRTLNGTPIRSALSLWWNDVSAEGLRDGEGGVTVPLGSFDSVNAMDRDAAAIGDLAVTSDGVHVLVYLGDQTWMEADPVFGRVVEETVPSDVAWFETPVVLMRWNVLADL